MGLVCLSPWSGQGQAREPQGPRKRDEKIRRYHCLNQTRTVAQGNQLKQKVNGASYIDRWEARDHTEAVHELGRRKITSFFLWLHSWHMEDPGPGTESKP